MTNLITLVSGTAATLMGAITVGTLVYFALLGHRRDRHSPSAD